MSKDAFTEVEMMFLAQLSYKDVPQDRFDSKTGEPVGDKGDYTLLEMITETENRDYLIDTFGKREYNRLLKKVKKGNYVVCKALNDRNKTGFAAIAISGPTKDTVTVAVRGTEGFNFDYDSRKDVYTDIQLGFLTEADQQKKMNSFMKGMERHDNIYLTGHSLGGNLAASGAIHFPYPDKIKGVNTYNAPGFNSSYLIANQKKIREVKNKITNYQNEGDGVSDMLEPVGKVVICASILPDTIFNAFGGNHLMGAFYVTPDGNLVNVPEKSAYHTGIKISVYVIIAVIEVKLGIPGMFFTKQIINVIIKTYEPPVQLTILIMVGKWARNYLEPGTQYVKDKPYFTVDTSKLRSHAESLDGINARLNALDRRLNSLYKEVGLSDIWNLIKSDWQIGKSARISRSAMYLRETADEFEKIEKDITSQLG
ncbi:MAG: DUF2974 domain-containing protein [Clostridium sp.]|mgnify:CR=1 FL=1|nr:DUF2974 domain-containing protein [Clostridium sp.]